MDRRQADGAVKAMEAYFGEDRRRIRHAKSVMAYAEKIQKVEGGDADLVRAVGALHDIGIHEAERKHGSSAGIYQEQEGPDIATGMLNSLGVDNDDIDHICKIIANHHSDKGIDTVEFRVLWDADWLVNIPDEVDTTDKEKVERLINRVFKTATGRRLASEEFL